MENKNYDPATVEACAKVADKVKAVFRYAEQFRDSLPQNDRAGRARVSSAIERARALLSQFSIGRK